MKGCYKTKDILKRGTILCMAAMLSFGTVACGSNSSKSASSSEKSTESSASSSTEAGKSTESTSGSSTDNSTSVVVKHFCNTYG